MLLVWGEPCAQVLLNSLFLVADTRAAWCEVSHLCMRLCWVMLGVLRQAYACVSCSV